jgi:hypothetical protein
MDDRAADPRLHSTKFCTARCRSGSDNVMLVQQRAARISLLFRGCEMRVALEFNKLGPA